jgi:hypothetical protein
MKRAFAVLASASFILAIGCSDYDIRMGKTLEERRYQKNLNTYLEDAAQKGSLHDGDIYIRPPKGHKGPTQAFGLPGVEPEKFDIENSFIDTKDGTSFHVLARIKRPKGAAPAKKGVAVATEAPAPARGKFLDDVVDALKGAYNVELTPGEFKAKSESHLGRVNDYKHKLLDLTTKLVDIYVYTESSGVHEVAMIFEHPKEKNLDTKIKYCLESFGVSDRARNAYAGTTDLDAGEMIGSGAPPPI